MEFEEMFVKDLRAAARHFAPKEACGVGGVAHAGTKEDLIALLRGRGVMACEADDFLKSGVPDSGSPASSGDDSGDVIEALVIDDGPNEGEDGGEDGGKCDVKGDELEIIRKIITKGITPKGVDEETVSSIVDKRLELFREKFRRDAVRVIEVKQPNELPNKVIGVCHNLTKQIAEVCNLGVHQMLVGPAGGGKTTCCEKVAEILNLKFYPMSVGPQTTKSDLLGFIDAAGNYHTTPLRDAFENGGLLLLDEVDAANAGVLTIINSLLANGYCSFPDGVRRRNDNFRCICACNTYGRGADRQYVGRNQLDAATLDRFAVVDFDYDENLERAIAGNDAWVEKVQAYRKRAFELKMRVVISPRASIFGAKLLAAGMKEKQVEELVVWKGVSAEIRSKITAA
ncbi:MAG: AAA family ATPase [Victivallaceae bacterium]|nr:AAA family ATPase [Victivallaceae bacterium]